VKIISTRNRKRKSKISSRGRRGIQKLMKMIMLINILIPRKKRGMMEVILRSPTRD
jgi:gamma-glutamyl phosphate reductase